jgi:hypothetical protein
MTEDQRIEEREHLIDRGEDQGEHDERPISAQVPEEEGHVGISVCGKTTGGRAGKLCSLRDLRSGGKENIWTER